LFAAAPPVQPADEIVDEMLAASLEVLHDSGFMQYEVSAYATAGSRCAHNLNYWNFGDYLGIGAGAHGKITDAASGVISRTQRWREPRRYLAEDPETITRRVLTARELPFEFAMNGFRLVEGFSEASFSGTTGLTPTVLENALAPVVRRGLVERVDGTWRATPLGFRFLNDVLVPLLPDTGSTASS
jgi:coproporphyrinogen III oxidase-like Fe-S oxidoreductase